MAPSHFQSQAMNAITMKKTTITIGNSNPATAAHE
jgi:hypothetical protein